MENLKASIVITTKNRRDELAGAIESCLKQKGNPEIFIFDDGSEDGTFQFVKDNYPLVRIHREEISVGLINARTKAAHLVNGEIIFSIDDDAVFSDGNIITDILKDFNSPQIGVVAIPLVNIKFSDEILQKAPDINFTYVTAQYIGTAHAIRKDVFINLGGYSNFLVRQGEEMDFCMRLIDKGYYVKLGNSSPINHYESPKRNKSHVKFYRARNNVLFVFQYVPAVFLFFHLFINIFNLLRYSEGYFNSGLKGVLAGVSDFMSKKEIPRTPVSIKTYFKFSKLKNRAIKISEIK